MNIKRFFKEWVMGDFSERTKEAQLKQYLKDQEAKNRAGLSLKEEKFKERAKELAKKEKLDRGILTIPLSNEADTERTEQEKKREERRKELKSIFNKKKEVSMMITKGRGGKEK